jgi:hypothetical protein
MFLSDILQSEPETSLGDCDMACAGDATEVCGGGRRILIFEDMTRATIFQSRNLSMPL